MEWLNVPTIGAIVTILGSFIGTVMVIVKDRRSAPIDRKTAELATASSITSQAKTTVDMALSINSVLQADNKRLSEDNESEREKVHLWEHWYTDLQIGWAKIRLELTPPAAPVYDKD